MKVCGVICEYNPFHAGHAYMVGEVRRALGADVTIAAVMGVSAEKAARRRAQILCCGTSDAAKLKYRYVGAQDCAAANRIGGGAKACPNGCIGLGSCSVICCGPTMKRTSCWP